MEKKDIVRIFLMAVIIVAGLTIGEILHQEDTELAGYHVTRYQDEFTVWEQMPIMDGFDVKGDEIHPGIFRLSIATIEGVMLYLDVYDGSGEILYSIADVQSLSWEYSSNQSRQLGLWYGVYSETVNSTCLFSCPIKLYVETWEWIELEPTVTEWTKDEF